MWVESSLWPGLLLTVSTAVSDWWLLRWLVSFSYNHHYHQLYCCCNLNSSTSSLSHPSNLTSQLLLVPDRSLHYILFSLVSFAIIELESMQQNVWEVQCMQHRPVCSTKTNLGMMSAALLSAISSHTFSHLVTKQSRATLRQQSSSMTTTTANSCVL